MGGIKRLKLTLGVKGGWQPSSGEEGAFIMRTRTLGRRERHGMSDVLPIIFGVGQPRLNVSSGFWGDRREARLGMVQNRRRRPRVASMAFRWHDCAKKAVGSVFSKSLYSCGCLKTPRCKELYGGES